MVMVLVVDLRRWADVHCCTQSSGNRYKSTTPLLSCRHKKALNKHFAKGFASFIVGEKRFETGWSALYFDDG